MKMDKEGGRRRAGVKVKEGKTQKKSPSGGEGTTGGKQTEMSKCASKMSFEAICGQSVIAFFFFKNRTSNFSWNKKERKYLTILGDAPRFIFIKFFSFPDKGSILMTKPFDKQTLSLG